MSEVDELTEGAAVKINCGYGGSHGTIVKEPFTIQNRFIPQQVLVTVEDVYGEQFDVRAEKVERV